MQTAKTFSIEEIQELGANASDAAKIHRILKNYQATPQKCWQELTGQFLHPDMPAGLHQKLFQWVYHQDEKYSDAPPAWFPVGSTPENSNLKRFMRKKNFSSYQAFHHYSVTQRPEFWNDMLHELNIPFDTAPRKVVDASEGLESPDWLPGAKLNIAGACFGEGNNQTAIVYGKENGALQTMTYGELDGLSSRIANSLTNIGFEKDDRAAIVMPMTAEAVAVYLGIVKAGGAVVSIADSLAPDEVEKRLKIAGTRMVFTQDKITRGGKEIPLYSKLLQAEMPQTVILPEGIDVTGEIRHNDLTWKDFLVGKESFDPISCQPADYCNILFSSGTTGDPKAIPWTHTTPVKAASDGYFHQDIQQGDVVAWPTNIGWMMGPWLIFATLINRGTIALFYGAPTGQPFGKFVQDAGVNMLGVVPSMVKRWMETGCMQGLDWSSIKLFSSTGESSNPQDYLWLMARGGYKPIIEYCGGTEIGGGYLTNTLLQPASPSTFTTPTLGLDLVILDENAEPSVKGEVFLVPPSIGLSNTLLNKNHNKTYYSGLTKPDENWEGALGSKLGEQTVSLKNPPILRRHGDEIRKLKNGYFRAQGRADDTMNLGGIKTSSVEIERLLDMVEGIKETAAIAVESASGGPKELVVYYVPKDGAQIESQRYLELFQDTIRNKLNPLFKISAIVPRDSLPRTASNKVMRRVLREEYERGDG
ncbi:MAG: AMP-binding protein [Bacteroidales bacterium]|nr:AMP-binding protein [Bacteroidales bacterium]MCF8333857.1 AMP-binding protein [Bacteroidales bacterium]